MPIDILMPALSPTVEKGNLARWLKKEGDIIKPGDVLAEIETDKATMEVEAIEEGVLARIVVPAGTADVPVNDVIGLIEGEGEDAKSVANRTVPAMEKTPDVLTATPAAGPALNGDSGPRVFASPLARRIAKESGLDLASIRGSGPHGRIIEGDV
ncbi:MAG TPA: biotin/lipoyl-containing protein, partial [Methylocella sp.]|nr:biotin/lipoyl-containing protein [Methylocella sp.]